MRDVCCVTVSCASGVIVSVVWDVCFVTVICVGNVLFVLSYCELCESCPLC